MIFKLDYLNKEFSSAKKNYFLTFIFSRNFVLLNFNQSFSSILKGFWGFGEQS
jgi:hypothetical protein